MRNRKRIVIPLPAGIRALGVSIIPMLIWLCWMQGAGWTTKAFAQEPPPLPPPDIGVFDILADGKRVGTERFEIRASESGWVVAGELQLQAPGGDKMTETSSLTLNSSLYPTYYERTQKSPRSGKLTVQFSPNETLLEMTASEGDPYQQIFYLPRNDLAVLDTNFFHQFTLLLRLYNHERGMAQPLNVFIPQEALPGIVNLQYIARENVPSGETTVALDHFQAVTDELEMEIWATPQGAIQRISIPQASLEIVRQ